MSEKNKVSIYIGDKKIGEAKPITIKDNRDHLWEFYLKEGNRYFFRNPYSKIDFELDTTLELKYGDKVEINFKNKE